MKKKTLSVILLFCMLVGSGSLLTACGKGAVKPPGSDSEPIKIGFNVVSLTDSFIKSIADGLVEYYKKDGIEVIVSSADGSPDKQVQQLENFAAMGVKEVLVMPMNSKGLEPVVKELRDKGISVVFVGNKPDYAVDGSMSQDNVAIAKMICNMATKWLDNAYPNAAPGSVHVAVLTSKTLEDSKKRSAVMIETIKADPRVKVVFEKEAGTETSKALDATNEALATDNSIKLVLSFAIAGGIGANTVIMGQKGIDPAKYAVFTGDLSPAGVELVEKSKTNQSVLRGMVQTVGGDNPSKDFYDVSRKVLKKEVPLPYHYVAPMTPVNSVGYTETK